MNNRSVIVAKQVLSEREVKNEMTALSRQESYVACGKRSGDTGIVCKARLYASREWL